MAIGGLGMYVVVSLSVPDKDLTGKGIPVQKGSEEGSNMSAMLMLIMSYVIPGVCNLAFASTTHDKLT